MIFSSLRTGGVPAGIAAFCIWGTLVIYWKQLDALPAVEILLYRMAGAFFLLLPFVWLTGRWSEVRQVLRTAALRWRLLWSALLVTFNWGLYIWAVTNGRITETSLGYYINPLTNVLAGAIFCQERPCRLQWVAVIIAALGVAWSLVAYGAFPWVSLSLALSFTAYGLIRKTIAVGALSGLFIETLIMALPSLAVLIWLHWRGEGHFFSATATELVFILGAGLVTTLPLLLFTYAARHMTLAALGLTQYLSPSLALGIGVLLYEEPVSQATMITFGCIWTALCIFSWSSLRQHYQTEALRQIDRNKP